jgi:hypothetical protein
MEIMKGILYTGLVSLVLTTQGCSAVRGARLFDNNQEFMKSPYLKQPEGKEKSDIIYYSDR